MRQNVCIFSRSIKWGQLLVNNTGWLIIIYSERRRTILGNSEKYKERKEGMENVSFASFLPHLKKKTRVRNLQKQRRQQRSLVVRSLKSSGAIKTLRFSTRHLLFSFLQFSSHRSVPAINVSHSLNP